MYNFTASIINLSSCQFHNHNHQPEIIMYNKEITNENFNINQREKKNSKRKAKLISISLLTQSNQ